MFDPAQFLMSAPPLTVAVGIILAAFLSEDAATLAAATLSATCAIEPKLGFASAVAGIWLGDLGLYAVAYFYGQQLLEKRWARAIIRPDALERGRSWFNRNNGSALFLSRCMPGTRLPVSLAAGTFRMRVSRFASIGIAGAITWVAINFAVIQYSHSHLHRFVRVTPTVGLAIGALMFAAMLLVQSAVKRLSPRLRRWSKWEFWPAWLFYIPVVGMWIWLGLKNCGFSLPAVANPSQQNGGLVGESKAQILNDLRSVAPDVTADAYLLEEGEIEFRLAQVLDLVGNGKLMFPFVMKPNVGQRGAGFRKISSIEQAACYLVHVPSAVIAQRYVPGPQEAGIFYVRLPGEIRGEILAITDKQFPVVIGDGISTLEALIYRDSRASIIAQTYLRRFSRRRDEIIGAGKAVRLVEAGNHCQGCVFADGMHLYSEALRERVDQISQALPEFYIGRYDVRYTDEAALRRGEFQIIELNGAASEATSIYDAHNSLWYAYKVLYKQWALTFAAGAANRNRGFMPPSLFQLAREWMAYTRRAEAYPLAD